MIMKTIIRWLRAILGTGVSTAFMVSGSLPGVPGSDSRKPITSDLSIYQIGRELEQVELLIERDDYGQASQMLHSLTLTVSGMDQHLPGREQIVLDIDNLSKRIISITGLGL